MTVRDDNTKNEGTRMPDARIKTWLDIAPAFVDFSIKFLRSPSRALEAFRGSGSVSADLANVLLGGVAMSYVLVFVAGSPELQQDTGRFAEFLDALASHGGLIIPAAAVLAAVFVGVATHVLASGLSHLFGGRLGLYGSMEDSINAVLACSAVFVPLFVAVICLLPYLEGMSDTAVLYIGLALIFAVVLAALVYLPSALSATHPGTNRLQAGFLLILGLGAIVVGAGVVRSLARS